MDYLEEVIKPGAVLTEHTIRELHAMTVHGLRREGDRTPGAYREGAEDCRNWSASSIETTPLNTR